MNSNEEIPFSVFSSNATETSRGATKKHLRASVSKRHVKIFLTCEKKKKTTRDEFDHDRQKSQTTSFIYKSTEKDNTNGHTISGGYGVTGTATLVMTTDALRVCKAWETLFVPAK